MTTHEFNRPIPPGTVRVSVIHSGDSFTLDLPSDRIGQRSVISGDAGGDGPQEAAGVPCRGFRLSECPWNHRNAPWAMGDARKARLGMASRRASPYIGCMEHRSGDAFTP